MVSVKAFFAYLSYALLAAVVFPYTCCFPIEAVKAYMDGQLAAIDPSLTMAAETMRPAIPPGLKMTGVGHQPRNRVRLVRFDDARLSPVLTTLLGKHQAGDDFWRTWPMGPSRAGPPLRAAVPPAACTWKPTWTRSASIESMPSDQTAGLPCPAPLRVT